MRYLFAFVFLAAPVAAETCPANVSLPADHAALMEDIRTAPDPETARLLSMRAWENWATAPDAHAQGLLDEGMSRRSSYDYAGAQKAFEALVEYCPDYPEGYNQRAFIAFLRGDYEAALADIEITLARVPNHFGALSGRALTLMNMGQFTEGQEALKEALAVNPWLPERHMLIPEPGTEL
ncbi:tetratricopeptide repeat protein [Actibacterium pelagium]|nr:tetratricopeptide repeat protein [Actibacterium pelagium]